MTGAAPSAWSAWDAVAACPQEEYRGAAWRAHHKDYAAISWDGSLRSSGRYNRGPVEFPGERTWPALYLALRPEICWPEITRHSPVTPRHNHFLLTTLEIHLFRVVIARDPVRLGIPVAALLQDQTPSGTGYEVSQRLALAALEQGADGLLVPSATLLGECLIVLPDNLVDPEAQLQVVESRQMRPFASTTSPANG